MMYEIKLYFGRGNLDIMLGYFEPQEWLCSEVGVEGKDWNWTMADYDDTEFGTGFPAIDRIQFKREEDKVKFILRWL